MCAVFGVFNNSSAAYLTYLGLRRLQHRGQESSGIAVSNGADLKDFRGMGLVKEIFNEDKIAELVGTHAIGHNRYSTAGESSIREAQPFVAETKFGKVAVVHNGNLPYAEQVRAELRDKGVIMSSTSDTEIVLHLIAASSAKDLPHAIAEVFRNIQGAYSMVFLTSNRMVAVRDPWGFRPLCIATLGDSYVVSSETCPFNLIDAQYWREVEPGEVVVFEPGREPSSHFPFPKRKPAECVFEKVYFARPDSMVFGGSANRARHLMGVHLAKEHALEADMVVPIPDSGVPAAAGFAKQSGIAFMHALIRDHYMGRTFIDPQNQVRYQKVRFKFNTIDDLIRGKRVILVDDSLVRGTTTREVVGMVRRAGAAAVSVLISSPSTIDPCFFGIDTPTHDELIAARYTVEEIRQTLGADYLGYLSLKGMLESADDAENKRTCHACFSGDYPIEVGGGLTKTERDRM